MLLLLLSIAAAFFAYLIFYKPEWIAVGLFTMIISSFNMEIQGMPMNLRAVISIALLVRVLTDVKGQRKYATFFGLSTTLILLAYLIYTCLVSYWQDLFSTEFFKQNLSVVIAIYCAFHFYHKRMNADLLKYALIISGLICFFDLAYTYIYFGSFPVHRILGFLTVSEVVDYGHDGFYNGANHNFFGQITSMTFLVLITDWIKKHPVIRKLIFLAPLMVVSVAMSTSRSSIIGLVVATTFLLLIMYADKERRSMIRSLFFWGAGSLIALVVLFYLLAPYLHLEGNFVDELMLRMMDEPTAMLKKALGQNYDIQSLGSMDWREEASANAYAAYSRLPTEEQIFGIGHDGYIIRDLGNGLNPHNGIMIILIEYGFVGFVMFFSLFMSVIGQMRKYHNSDSTLFIVLLFVILYGIPQNNELTSSTTLLFLFSLVAENHYLRQKIQSTSRPSRIFLKYRDRKNLVAATT